MINGVLLQGFHWSIVDDGTLWNTIAQRAEELSKRGFTSIWLPPANKGAGGSSDVGYGVYDLYDLGEFDQKGSVRTKYGTKDEYLACVKQLQDAGMSVLADAVLNHRLGGDAEETFVVQAVDNQHRLQNQGEVFEDSFWTRFDFPDRDGKYSTFTFNHEHFVGVGENDDHTQVFRKADKGFAEAVDKEFENYDYLLGADVDLNHPAVREELFGWMDWFLDTTGVDGFRLDAVKHMDAGFTRDLLQHLRDHVGDPTRFTVSEYWSSELDALTGYIDATEGMTHLFDVPLHMNLHRAAQEGDQFDLTKIFENTLVSAKPELAVTFVDNHDTQPGQSLESWVDDWFKPHAYALILLRQHGYPVVFAGDYDGGRIDEGQDITSHRELLDRMLDVRERFNFGDQHDIFDDPNCIAWTRTGDDEHPGCMVVIMSNGQANAKVIETHRPNETFFSTLGNAKTAPIQTDDEGKAEFTCLAGTTAIWVSDAHGLERWKNIHEQADEARAMEKDEPAN